MTIISFPPCWTQSNARPCYDSVIISRSVLAFATYARPEWNYQCTNPHCLARESPAAAPVHSPIPIPPTKNRAGRPRLLESWEFQGQEQRCRPWSSRGRKEGARAMWADTVSTNGIDPNVSLPLARSATTRAALSLGVKKEGTKQEGTCRR